MGARIAKDRWHLNEQMEQDLDRVTASASRQGRKILRRGFELQALMQGGDGTSESYAEYMTALHDFGMVAVGGMGFIDLLGRYRAAQSTKKRSEGVGVVQRLRGLSGLSMASYAALNESLPKYLDLPFDEAIDILAELDPILIKHREEVKEAYLAKHFFLSQATNLRVVELTRNALKRTVEEGGSRRDFIQTMFDSGAKEFSEGYMTTVFRTNLNTAQTAGRMRMLSDPDLEGFIVALEYSARIGHPSPPRPNHAKMDGFIADIRHPVWRIWLPPNGFNCRCTVLEVSRPEAENMGRIDNQGRFKSDSLRGVKPDKGFEKSPVGELFGARAAKL